MLKSEDELQYSVRKLNNTASEYSMGINTEKSKVTFLRGK